MQKKYYIGFFEFLWLSLFSLSLLGGEEISTQETIIVQSKDWNSLKNNLVKLSLVQINSSKKINNLSSSLKNSGEQISNLEKQSKNYENLYLNMKELHEKSEIDLLKVNSLLTQSIKSSEILNQEILEKDHRIGILEKKVERANDRTLIFSTVGAAVGGGVGLWAGSKIR